MAAKISPGRFFGRTLGRCQVDDLVVIASRHAAGTRLPRHFHERPYFCINRGGTYVEQYGRRRRKCRPGMLVFHPAGECHAEEHDSDVASVNVELGASWLGRAAEFSAPLDQPVELGGEDVAALGAQIVGELAREDGDSPAAIEAATWEILAAVAGRRAAIADAAVPRWLRDARERLDARPAETPSLRAIAAAAGVHPVHFASTFRRFFGCSVGEYARRRRFEHARRRLADGDASLTEVAAEAGYADQSHLTRVFKRLSGMTPARYRSFLAFKTTR
jgi:AraC family transcriptional regulator